MASSKTNVSATEDLYDAYQRWCNPVLDAVCMFSVTCWVFFVIGFVCHLLGVPEWSPGAWMIWIGSYEQAVAAAVGTWIASFGPIVYATVVQIDEGIYAMTIGVVFAFVGRDFGQPFLLMLKTWSIFMVIRLFMEAKYAWQQHVMAKRCSPK